MKRERLFRFLLTVLLCGLFSVDTSAVPAAPWPFKVQLPDGTYITIKMTGDEFFMATTTIDGYNVVMSDDGYYHYAEDAGGRLVSTGVRARDPERRTAEDRAVLSHVLVGTPAWAAAAVQSSPLRRTMGGAERAMPQRDKELKRTAMNSGEKFKTLVILVNFQDKKFNANNPPSAFHDLLNKHLYSHDYSVGSARDYFLDNSNGRLDPQFDVVGPYTVAHDRDYYKWNNQNGLFYEMIAEAVLLADPDVDFSQYSDGDTARGVYVFFAGESNMTTSIWPHKWSLEDSPYGRPIYCDGKKVSLYACSGECEENDPYTRSRIGNFCHEFGHILGWPDFYDTDYDQNGTSVATSVYSLMDMGCKNNRLRTPPASTAMERWLAGWLEPTPLTTSGDYTLKPVTEDDAYIIHTDVANESFLLEVRGFMYGNKENKWEKGLAAMLNLTSSFPQMMVYHVDRSDNNAAGYPAWQLWEYNAINRFADHECFKVVRASTTNNGYWGYPGPSRIATLSSETNSEFIAWSGEDLPEVISDIAVDGTNVSFRLVSSADNIAISLDNSNIELYESGTAQLHATITPEEHAGMEVEWSSSNPAVATVNADGVVRAVSPGRAIVTAKLKGGSAQASCNVVVTQLSITLDKSEIEILIGSTGQLTATVKPESFSGMEIEWSSNNTDVATVDASGLVTAVSPGQAMVSAKVKEGTAEASCKVDVVDPSSPTYVDAVRQNDIWIRWEPSGQHNGKYRVEISRGGEMKETITTSETWAYADCLIPGTSYSATVYLDNNGSAGTQVGKIDFKTLDAGEFPASVGFTSPDAEGRITLYLQDIAEGITSVKWSVNGDAVEYPRFKPEAAGRYTITAGYETEQWSETITKVITVK